MRAHLCDDSTHIAADFNVDLLAAFGILTRRRRIYSISILKMSTAKERNCHEHRLS